MVVVCGQTPILSRKWAVAWDSYELVNSSLHLLSPDFPDTKGKEKHVDSQEDEEEEKEDYLRAVAIIYFGFLEYQIISFQSKRIFLKFWISERKLTSQKFKLFQKEFGP